MKFRAHRMAGVIVLIAVIGTGSGCSLRKMAVNEMADTLSSDSSVFTSDDDIELVGGALPFSLKLVESLLQQVPDHRGLLLTAASGFTLYSYAYVDFPAEQAAVEDVDRAVYLRGRARRLYLRAFNYAMRGLEVRYPGFRQELAKTPDVAAARVTDSKEDVPFLYWGAASLGLAISVSKDDPAMLARLGEVEAMLDRALALDESYDDGALHEFAVTWASSVPGAIDRAAVEKHYKRAVELAKGRRAGLFVTYAMAVAVPDQNRAQFRALMEKALAVDPNADPRHRLANLIAQRRARWLLSRIDELFLE